MKIHHCVVVSLLLLLFDSLSSLPATVFFDNNEWPSDLISAGNSNDDDEVGKVLDFNPLKNPYVISDQSNLNYMVHDPHSAQGLRFIFNNKDDDIDGVEVQTSDGAWIEELFLPDASEVPNLSKFQLSCNSALGVMVYYNKDYTTRTVSSGKYVILAVLNGVWITEEEYNSPATRQPTSAPTVNLTSPPTVQPTSAPTVQPKSGPTKNPTSTPTAPSTVIPTLSCAANEKPFLIYFMTDASSKWQNRIVIRTRKKSGRWKIIAKLKDFPKSELYHYSMCLAMDSCNKFILKDRKENGFRKGSYYELYWGGYMVEHDTFLPGMKKQVVEFGYCGQDS